MSLFVKKDQYVIENDNLALEISTSRSKVKSFSVLNKLSGRRIFGEEDSELFVLCFKGGLVSEKLLSKSLKISGSHNSEEADKDTLSIEFSEVRVKGARLKITLVYELEKDAHYIRKHLEIFSDDVGEKAVLDYIDFFPVNFGRERKTSSIPEQQKSHISGFALSLGQPIYVDSAFLGCEFPATVNKIESSVASVRYYSGKPMAALIDKNARYVSKTAVMGVAESDDETVLRLSFLEYIKTISKPLRMRVQYNSWYDHMLDISDENIEQSFLEIEKAMTAAGTRPLDSFVVDDGWNDYKADFWRFNGKFPNELYPASALSKAFGSSFGLWLGPRGGYTGDTIKFAKQIENAGNGFVNRRSHDIDVGSEKYINRVSDLMSDYQKRFDLKYWKLDGFIQKPCRNANHDHIVGGKDDMYYYSEVWERWLGVFERLENESKDGIFINLTCYAPPSPWMLRWVNCMWLQVSDDMGLCDKTPDGRKLGGSKKDQLLTYRDDRYYDFLRQRKFSFPQARLYNHDPIYANKAGITMTDEEFRVYLFTMAARGNAFWELYYSFDLMNEEKWRINNSALCFVRENLHLLENSVMFGARPSEGKVYGFSGFMGGEGIVMLRNSGGEAQKYILRLDESIGVTKALSFAKTAQIFPYNKSGARCIASYGDTLEVNLGAFETRIYSFGKTLSKVKAEYIRPLDKNKLEVMFDQTVITDEIFCEQNKIISAKLLGDMRSVVFEFENDFEKAQVYKLSAVKNIYLEGSECEIKFEYHENDVISDAAIRGKGEFSIVATTGGEDVDVLFRQGDEILLGADGGKFRLRVGSTVVTSNASVQDVVQVCAVRERTGVLKLYLNKKLDSGARSLPEVCDLLGEDVYRFDENKVKVYSKALSYSQV